MNDDDMHWADALAGREIPDSATRREAEVLRAALRTTAAAAADVLATADPAREAALLALAAQQGLLPARLAIGRRDWQWAIAATVLLVMGAGISLQWLREAPAVVVERGDRDGIVRITAAQPAALKQQLLRELRAVGVAATGYEALDVHGIDADLPLPLSEAVRQVLGAHQIPEPADGVLRIEIRSRP
jgi:hypothetical protein